VDDEMLERDALRWLALVDEGRLAESWAEASGGFRRAVSEARWAEAVDSARSPFGALRSRTLQDVAHATELPGAPDGEYAVLTFGSAFDHKRSAVETLTLARDTDGAWRAAGYFIR
jgi:serine/threonine-protein kinase